MTCLDLTLPPYRLPDDASLFIDFDGTLVELVDRPENVVVDPELVGLLADLGTAFPDRTAIVSGRSIAQLDAFLGELARSLILIGSHGAERRLPNEDIEAPRCPPGLDRAEAALSAFALRNPGAVIERKSFGVTLHYRLAPALEADALDFAERVALDAGLEPQLGKYMVDLKLPGESKGTALSRTMQLPGLAASRPWFIGDDLTDETGFATAMQLGGHGVIVGMRRPTAAGFALPDVGAVRDWLRRILESRR